MIEGFGQVPERHAEWASPGIELERCFEPESVEELGSILASASRGAEGVLVVGGGTRLGWANPARGIRYGVSTLALAGVDIFEPDEGVLHARAGSRVADVRGIAAAAGWELPLDPPGLSSTIGGTIASAATGPRSQAFGRVADAILGLDVVGANGVATKCGGRVVKNVTGYDLAKLYCGSFGTLGVLTGAWLRLRPVVAKRIALRAPLPTDPDGFEAARALSALTSVRALVWVEGEFSDASEGVYFELAGSGAEVAHDLDSIGVCLATREIGSERIDALRDVRAQTLGAPVVIRARVPGRDAGRFVRRLRNEGLVVAADLGLGVVHARGTLDSVESLLALRAAAVERGGFMTFEALPDGWRDGVDVFGISPESQAFSVELERRFDPARILNPGRVLARR